ncbi:MAG: hypothetical protein SFW64_00065 [Alphaproteobacteria bacterium]|nr:hypothetical protein [Alphaproteobacteria bacterium]
MHSRAYTDSENDIIHYQPLRSEVAPAIYSRPERSMTPAQMREIGKTRRAAVHGRTVAFMRLSPTCKVTPIWNTCWHEEYLTEDEAHQAAAVWERRVMIMQPGFSARQA